jgi:hypothetical protein
MSEIPPSLLFMLCWSCGFFFTVRVIVRRDENLLDMLMFGKKYFTPFPEWIRPRYDLRGRWQYDVVGLIVVMVVFNVWVVPQLFMPAK